MDVPSYTKEAIPKMFTSKVRHAVCSLQPWFCHSWLVIGQVAMVLSLSPPSPPLPQLLQMGTGQCSRERADLASWANWATYSSGCHGGIQRAAIACMARSSR